MSLAKPPAKKTYLEITGERELRPAGEPRVDATFELVAPDPALNRELYAEIGAPFAWTDRTPWSDVSWERWVTGVETWVVRVGGDIAGFAELRPEQPGAPPSDAGILIALFGIREPYRGSGLGGALLTRVIRRGFELAQRVWVETNPTDGQYALASYEARGMRQFDRA